MSQRGGDVQSNLRINSGEIYSDLIGRGAADAIISLEPMEALRYLPFLADGGWIVTNSTPFVNIPNYPDQQAVADEINALPNVIMLDVDTIAREAGVARGANMVLLGAASLILGIEFEELKQGIRNVFGRKGEAVVESNIKALEAGREAAQSAVKQ